MRDPICGMEVGPSDLRLDGHEDVALCSAGCRETFLRQTSPQESPTAAPEEGNVDAERAASARRYRLLIRKFWFAAAVSLPVIYFSYPEIFPGVPEKGSTALCCE